MSEPRQSADFVPWYRRDPSEPYDWACCEHCGCATNQRIGHDDTCRFGCNDDPELTDGTGCAP